MNKDNQKYIQAYSEVDTNFRIFCPEVGTDDYIIFTLPKSWDGNTVIDLCYELIEFIETVNDHDLEDDKSNPLNFQLSDEEYDKILHTAEGNRLADITLRQWAKTTKALQYYRDQHLRSARKNGDLKEHTQEEKEKEEKIDNAYNQLLELQKQINRVSSKLYDLRYSLVNDDDDDDDDDEDYDDGDYYDYY